MASMTRRIAVAAMALVLATTMTAYAAPQRGGGSGHGFSGGGGHGFGGGRGFSHGPGFARGPRFDGRGRFDHGHFRGPFFGGFYDPFYPYDWFPFAVYPYADFSYGLTLDADIHVKVDPKDAQVFVDGYYAGQVDDFDGAFQRLHVTPGGHAITIYLDGYRTVTKNLYARPDGTVTFTDQLQALGPGEVSAPPPPPVNVKPPSSEQGE
jgi:hypothetical protein